MVFTSRCLKRRDAVFNGGLNNGFREVRGRFDLEMHVIGPHAASIKYAVIRRRIDFPDF